MYNKYMYVYYQPQGGWADMLRQVKYVYDYCTKYNRTLLLNYSYSHYKIKLSDYISIPHLNIIYDDKTIFKICDECDSYYPEGVKNNIIKGHARIENFVLPSTERLETIIVFAVRANFGIGYHIFKEMDFCADIKNECRRRYALLVKPYVCIQVRNTDYKCDYISHYHTHKEEIMSYPEVFLATDNKEVIEFYKSVGVPIKNFTTFPNKPNTPLHMTQEISPHTKFIDLICDMYLCTMSDKLISSSFGGFISIIRDCWKDKENFHRKIALDDTSM